jgi:hypothetical protein
MVITLTKEEARWAMEVGKRRHDECVRKGYRQTDGTFSGNGEVNHMRGAAAELAVAKFLGWQWGATVNTFNDVPDLGEAVEVRSHVRHQRYLRLKQVNDSEKNDKRNSIFVSVARLGDQRFRIQGWAYGREAMFDAYLVEKDPQSHKPEWHFPIEKLHSPESLIEVVPVTL